MQIPKKNLNSLNILKNDIKKYSDLQGLFTNNNSTLRIFETGALNISNDDVIEKKLRNNTSEFYTVTNSSFIDSHTPFHYKVDLLKQNSISKITKIEITNSTILAENLSSAFGINKDIVSIIIKNQHEIKKLFEEHNFITADSLVVAKEALIAVKTEDNKLEIDKILNILGILSTIATFV